MTSLFPEAGWATSRHDQQRTSATSIAGPAGEPEIVWHRDDLMWTPTMVASQDTVYVAQQTESDSRMYALDLATGETRWSRDIVGEQLFFDSLVAYGFVFVVGESKLGAFTVEDGDDPLQPVRPLGEKLDEITLPAQGENVFIRGDRLLQVATIAGRVTCDLDPPEVEVVPRSSTPPVDFARYDDWAVIVMQQEMMCYKGDNRIWEKPREFEPGVEQAIIGDDTVFLESDERLVAVELETGQVLWRRDHDPIRATAVTDKTVYSREDTGIVAVDAAQGKELWRWQPASGAPTVPPIVGGDMVYSGEYHEDAASVYGIDAETGEEVWEFDGLEDVYSLLLADGGLVVNAGDGIAALA